jgi:2-C-methyl-D-erythritol 4-phosphate cytidylyltransferase
VIGLVLAAGGVGRRFGLGLPKQFVTVQEKPLYARALEAFLPFVTEVVVVVPDGWQDQVETRLRSLDWGGRRSVSVGGAHRQDSVWAGIGRLSEEAKWILVHDAARPYVSGEVIQRVVEATQLYGACIPAVPVSETVKEVEADWVARTLDRGRLVRVQTPQGFARDLLLKAFEQARGDGFQGTDEAMLVERIGVPVRVVQGDPANLKITWREDLPELEGEAR